MTVPISVTMSVFSFADPWSPQHRSKEEWPRTAGNPLPGTRGEWMGTPMACTTSLSLHISTDNLEYIYIIYNIYNIYIIYEYFYIYMNIYICMESHTHDVRTVYICLHLSTFVYTDS